MICRRFDEIVRDYPQKSRLSEYALAKLPGYVAESLPYLAGNDLSCDCRFENDDGRYLYAERDDAKDFVLLATSGQGDEWLLRLADGVVCFLDHDIWEAPEAIFALDITYEQFVIMADLLGRFEAGPTCAESADRLKEQFNSISGTLFEKFPFNLS